MDVKELKSELISRRARAPWFPPEKDRARFGAGLNPGEALDVFWPQAEGWSMLGSSDVAVHNGIAWRYDRVFMVRHAATQAWAVTVMILGYAERGAYLSRDEYGTLDWWADFDAERRWQTARACLERSRIEAGPIEILESVAEQDMFGSDEIHEMLVLAMLHLSEDEACADERLPAAMMLAQLGSHDGLFDRAVANAREHRENLRGVRGNHPIYA